MKKTFLLSLMLSVTVSGGSYASSWNYDQHGDDWHEGVCATGTSQSPININTGDLEVGSYKANMSYKGKTVDAENNGHTVQFNPDGRTLEIVDNVSGTTQKFTLLQFHLHNGSEHTVDGVRHDLEAHFVHANSAFLAGDMVNGRLAVIGVFLNAGSESNGAWNKVLNDLPQYDGTHGDVVNKKIVSNYYRLLSESDEVYTYEGSLTTPGCNEIVNWIVMQEPVTVSPKAVKSFAASQHNHPTYRNTQPLNGRVVTSSEMTGSRQ